MEIDGAVVVVTGASSGIGAATARAASRAGAKVVLIARSGDRIRQLAEELGGNQGKALAVPCDVTDAAQVEAAVRAVTVEHGRIDVLVNNAGQGLQATIDEIDANDYRAILELNVVAPLVCTQAVLPIMRQQGAGSIVNVSSGIVWFSLPGSGAYASSKAALVKLTEIARVELADAGIAVSLMFPSITDTGFAGTVRGDVGGALAMEKDSGIERDVPEDAAGAIIDLIRSGNERADRVPVEWGGTLNGGEGTESAEQPSEPESAPAAPADDPARDAE